MPEVLDRHRWLTLLLALLFSAVSLSITSTVVADELPEHSHLMIQGLEVDENDAPVSYRRCVPLANNRKLPNHAHHDNLHDRSASGAQALEAAGNPVFPVFLAEDVGEEWATPWRDCASFDAWFAAVFG